jgi:hypothetical protein
MALGGAEVTNLISVMPPDWGAKLVSLGPLLLAAKPFLQIIGDWLDDGVKNDSFKFPSFALLPTILALSAGAMVTLPLVSCAQLASLKVKVDEDGYIMISKKGKDGQKYSYGALFTKEGKVVASRVVWKNSQGLTVRYCYSPISKRGVYQYLAADKTWLDVVPQTNGPGVDLDDMPVTPYSPT